MFIMWYCNTIIICFIVTLVAPVPRLITFMPLGVSEHFVVE